MTVRDNPIPWLVWAVAAVLLNVLTRNPILLGLAGIAILIVRTSLPSQPGAESLSWKLILRIAVLVAAVSVIFNLLTVHVGDSSFAHLPASIPIVGGTLTLNALVYGLAGGLALINLILVAATFSSAVDRGSLIRMLPPGFGSAGTATIVALSIFPQTLRAVREVHQAQSARGFRIRSIRDVEPLVVPVLHLGLEHAFELAESIEARGFGRRNPPPDRQRAFERLAPLIAITLATVGVILAGLGHFVSGGLLLGLGLLTFFSARLRRREVRRNCYRPVFWSPADLIGTTASAVAALLLLAALVFTAGLQYTPYPLLAWPSLSILPLIAVLLLLLPAFTSSAGKAA